VCSRIISKTEERLEDEERFFIGKSEFWQQNINGMLSEFEFLLGAVVQKKDDDLREREREFSNHPKPSTL